jgi:hypothetical protein
MRFPASVIYGYDAEWNGQTWVWSDTGAPVDENPRLCPKCGRLPTPEGHDACLGRIPGVESACCGHGRQNGYIIWTVPVDAGDDAGRGRSVRR